MHRKYCEETTEPLDDAEGSVEGSMGYAATECNRLGVGTVVGGPFGRSFYMRQSCILVFRFFPAQCDILHACSSRQRVALLN